MLRNNNSAVITRMAKRSLAGNRRRSVTMILAVLLSSFMLFTVFTVGVTYIRMYRLQNIRMYGEDADAIMYGVTEEQRMACEENPDIIATGICAVAGYVEETEADETPNVGLMWADETYWGQMMEPAREFLEGTYPQEADELMVTRSALKECGMEELGVGDSFSMTYGTPKGKETKIFRISGMWDGYGTKKVFYVSKAFYEQSGYELSDVASGRFYMDFRQKIMTQEEQDAFIESMNLGKQQAVFFLSDLGYSVRLLEGLIGIVLVTCLCAYLLIYNIMYLSVAGNVRYYGLLQTVGMTQRQVRQFMHRQMVFIGGVGIAAGVLLGSVVSLFLIPVIVKMLGIRTGTVGKIQVAFHPAILLVTIVLTGLTVWAAATKPTKKAVSISPMEALGYRPQSGRKRTHKTKYGRILWRMAKEQIKKDKKKTTVVLASLAVSLSVFLCMVTLIESQGARTIISNYMDMDLVIRNDTLGKEDHDKWKQLLDSEFLGAIKDNESVAELHPFLSVEITVPWEPDFADLWMEEMYAMWMNIPYEDDLEEYQEHPENFGSFLVGIDEATFDALNAELEAPLDKEAFLNGKTCVLYRNNLDFQIDDLKGKQVTCAEYADQENTRTFTIAGLTDENYYVGPMLGMPPTIIVSDQVVKAFVKEPFVYKAGVRYEKEYDEQAEADMTDLMEASPYAKDFSYDSKIEEKEEIEKAQGGMMEVGLGIVFVLAVIGIMNYVNTSAGNIQSRQMELAIMESVGMTGKQMRKMLVLEGLLYTAGALVLTVLVGLPVTYGLYQSMNYRDIAFAVPLWPLLGAAILTCLICVSVPLVAYGSLEKSGSLVERIR